MLIKPDSTDYDALCAAFRWQLPAQFNIGTWCADRVAFNSPDKIAIVDTDGTSTRECTFADLSQLSNRFANVLTEYGIRPTDRVALMAPQSIELAAAHLGIYKVGAIAVPMASQFGSHAIAYRLAASGTRVMLCTRSLMDRVIDALPASQNDIRIIVLDDDRSADELGFSALCAKAKSTFTAHPTTPDDPAMMLFTSGTTGNPKAALHGHRVLAGHLPGIQLSQNMLGQDGDCLWTPSDWAWAGGLLNALLTSLALSVTVVAARTTKFDPDWACHLIRTHDVRNLFMPATALRLMLSENIRAQDGPALLRSIGSAGESLGRETLMRIRQNWGITVNEFYGQTECNTVLGASNTLQISRPGAMGKPTPGHTVTILDENHKPLGPGQTGQIAIARPDPVMFLRYWNDDTATAQKFSGDWMLTGDIARIDSDGYFHFEGRNDDLITSSGYRIGPTEIEDALVSHPAVQLAAVIGTPDPVRTQTVTAFIVPANGYEATPELAEALKADIRTRLSAHQLPRIIHFVEHIPLTESGKIIRRHFRHHPVSAA